jgi:hypothetical protein
LIPDGDSMRHFNSSGIHYITFAGFVGRPDGLKAICFSQLYKMVRHGSLGLESQDNVYELSNVGTETNQENFVLVELFGLECGSTGAVNDGFDMFFEVYAEASGGS